MVGVAGKYKGCNTCRLRRVKCDNERPFCRKCTQNGRECGGYERETVFIVGTIEDGGRCSSHPPRRPAKKGKASSKPEEEERKLELVAVEPLKPAWDDLIRLQHEGLLYQVRFAALHMPLESVVRQAEDDDEPKHSSVSLPPYEPADAKPSLKDHDFDLKALAIAHLSSADDADDENMDGPANDNHCLFLFHHNNSSFVSNLPPWKDPSVQNNVVRRLGPDSFKTFPNHHFFVRVYRHNAICAALLNHKKSFLADQEWSTTPWEQHPKTSFDRLFDVVALLPSLLSRADGIFQGSPTLPRRLLAQDLLSNCLNLDRQFDAWYHTINPDGLDQTDLFWIDQSPVIQPQIPFVDTWRFCDSVTALACVYYWATAIMFYPYIERLNDAIFQPVVDSFPQMYPNLPSSLQVNPLKYNYKQVREAADNICRSFDFILHNSSNPDILVFPFYVVQEFYKEINMSTGDGQLELMWLEGFRVRLAAVGQDISEMVQTLKWQDVASW